MIFIITLVLIYSMTKKCCNWFNFVPCILWDLFVMSLVLSGGDLRSTCQKLKSHSRLLISWVFCEKGLPARYPRNSLPGGFLSVTFLPFTHTIYTHTIYTLITHKSMKGYSERKTLDRFSTTHTPIFQRERATHP